MQTNPCPAVFDYTETTYNGHTRVLESRCLTCGTVVGGNLLKSEEELHYWCDFVITDEDAKFCLKEFEDCHRAGISYGTYNGINDDGSDMTDDEYKAVLRALERVPGA